MLPCCQNWQIGYASTATMKRTALMDRGLSVSHFRGGYPDCDLAGWILNAPKMEGESKRGRHLSSWHTTFGESLVCYTFCPGWRGKGAAPPTRAQRSGSRGEKRSKGAGEVLGDSRTRSLVDFATTWDKRYINPPSLVPPRRQPRTRPGS